MRYPGGSGSPASGWLLWGPACRGGRRRRKRAVASGHGFDEGWPSREQGGVKMSLARITVLLLSSLSVVLASRSSFAGVDRFQAAQTVVEAKPMGDPQDVLCVASDEDCEITVTFMSPGPPATAYEVLIDGAPEADVDGDPRQSKEAAGVVRGLGQHCVATVGVLESLEGRYAGDPVSVCCDVAHAPVGSRLVHGACDETSRLDLSSAVLGLTFLLSGGDGKPDPACESVPTSEREASSPSCPS